MPLIVAVSYHSSNNNEAISIFDSLRQIRIDPIMITESEPNKLQARSLSVQSCSSIVVIASRHYQKSTMCMELLHYAKDLKKKIIVINPNQLYKPFGSLGAIAASSELGILQISFNRPFDIAVEKILDYFTSQRPKSTKMITDSNIDKDEKISLKSSNSVIDVLISYHAETTATVELIKESLNQNGVNYLIEECTTGSSSVNTAKVLVAVISPKYEECDFARVIVETARSKNKSIIPVKASQSFKPDKWLGLVIAGKLYYRIINKEEAYKQIYDTTPMNNLMYGIKIALAQKPSFEDRERAELNVIQKRIDECKAKLPTNWSPKLKERSLIEKKPVKVVLVDPKTDMAMQYIHYNITRMEFNAPKISYDNYGIPLRDKFDCMISYHLDYQPLVREIYMDMSMRNLRTWFGKNL